MSLGFYFFNWFSENACKGRGCQNLKAVQKNPKTLVSHVLKHQCLKYDLWEGSLPSCFVPGANFISHKSNEVPGRFSEGSFKMQTSYRSQVQVLPCVLLSCQFSALFLIRF